MKWKWSDNAEKEIKTGIAPFNYFKNIKSAKRLFNLEILNIEYIFSGNCKTKYTDDYTGDLIVRQYYNEMLNDLCQTYFNNDEYRMFNYINNNANNIKSFMFHKNYKSNLVPVSYHHKLQYYKDRDGFEQVISNTTIYFYMFNFVKYFERKK